LNALSPVSACFKSLSLLNLEGAFFSNFLSDLAGSNVLPEEGRFPLDGTARSLTLGLWGRNDFFSSLLFLSEEICSGLLAERSLFLKIGFDPSSRLFRSSIPVLPEGLPLGEALRGPVFFLPEPAVFFLTGLLPPDDLRMIV
jgi:hypothetical protein